MAVRVRGPHPFAVRTFDKQPWIIALVMLLAFARALTNGYTYDETLVIARAGPFLGSGAVGTLFSRDYFAASFEGTWRPLVTFSYMVDHVFGTAPAIAKTQSLLWHLAAALLLLAFTRRILPAPNRAFALVAALLFAVHPVVTETVDNASFREDSLVTVFVLGALLWAERGATGRALFAYALALLSKESAVVMPLLWLGFVVVGADTDGFARALHQRLARLGLFAVVTLGYLALRFGPMNVAGTYGRHPGGSLATTVGGMPTVFAHYLRLVALPWPLCADYGGFFAFEDRSVTTWIPAVLVGVAFAGAIAVTALRGQRGIAYGLGWFALALGPVANIVPIPVPAAERFLYLPLVGIAVAAAFATARIVPRLSLPGQTTTRALGWLVVLIWIGIANRRHLDWRDDATLAAATLSVNPQSCRAHSAVGGDLFTHGINTRSAVLLQDALAHHDRALALCPEGTLEPAQLSIFYTRRGATRTLLDQVGAARADLDAAIRLNPGAALPVAWLGYLQFLRGDSESAARLLHRALVELGPPDAATQEVAAQYQGQIGPRPPSPARQGRP